MLYHVQMDVRPPPDVDPERFERLKAEEKASRRSCNGRASGGTCGASPAATQYQRARRGKTMTSCTRISPRCRCFPSWKSR